MSALRNRGIATGIAALAVSALAVGGAVTPAQAHDNRGSKSEHSKKSDHHNLGARLYETQTLKLADGTIVAKNTRKGTISAVDATTVTVTSADTTSVVYTPAANTKLERNDAYVALSAFLVGDTVKVKSYTISGVETVAKIDAKGAVAPVATPSASPSHHEDGDDHDGLKIEYKGERISSVATYKKLDGTFETVAHYFGLVSAVTETTVTVTAADGSSTVYTPGAATVTRDRAAATLAQLVVGDHVRVSGTIAASVLTVGSIKAVSEAAWTARKCHDSVSDQAVVHQANTIKHERAMKVKAAKKAVAKKVAAKKAASKKTINKKKNHK